MKFESVSKMSQKYITFGPIFGEILVVIPKIKIIDF